MVQKYLKQELQEFIKLYGLMSAELHLMGKKQRNEFCHRLKATALHLTVAW